MRVFVQVISGAVLICMVLVSALFYKGSVSDEQLRNWLLACTVLWFVTAPFWMEIHQRARQEEPAD